MLLRLSLLRFPQTWRGTWWQGLWQQQQHVEMLQTGFPVSWEKQIGSSVHSKPDAVIKLPIIIALRTATGNLSDAFLSDLFRHKGLFFVLCFLFHVVEDPDHF